MQLPEKKKRKLAPQLEGRVIVVHGRPGKGKSSLAAWFPDNYFIATEPGLQDLEIIEPLNATNYKVFLEICATLFASDHQGWVTIDTYDKLVTMCQDYVCARNSIDHPSDMAHGKGWGLVTFELNRVLTKLANRFSLILISHTTLAEVQLKARKVHMATLNVGGKNRDIPLDMADEIFYIDSVVEDGKERRVIRTDSSVNWDAKDRSRLLPAEIPYPLGVDMYKELCKYFQNGGK